MNKKILYILSIVVAFGLMSCDEYLDTTPDNRTVLDSDEKVKELLTSAYPEMTYGLFCYSMSDNVADRGEGNEVFRNNEQGYFWEEFTETLQDSPSGYWESCYNAIAHTNQALEFIEDTKVEGDIPFEYLPYYGEALLVRAYCHFMLVNLWGQHYNPATADTDLGVPYVTEVEDVVFKNYRRETVAKVYELVEKDLLEGLKHIEDNAYDVPKYHFNVAAANTFASRFYQYKGEWQKVKDYATAALGAHPSAKLRDLAGKYNLMGINEQAAEYSKATEPANLMLTSNITYNFSLFQGLLRYGLSHDIFSKVFDDVFVQGASSNAWTQSAVTVSNNLVVWKWGYFFKRMDVNADIGLYYAMTPKIVAEEALFNRIEANIMLKKYTEAEDDLNLYFEKRLAPFTDENKVTEEKITERFSKDSHAASDLDPWYDLDEKTRTYLNCAIHTRRREFAYNGLRWFDIRRFNIKVIHEVNESTPVVLEAKDARKVLQIPAMAQQYGLEANNR
ncbi:RagB/SusD family nutrient uptake outer membrane protein [Marinifilum fragile]|uniref:RagB/SusD family nutrient uptake outer membrane protein n=1 Tax=Marinifilum fragile TaxID=570161 RepID=UPI002AA70862|nr:RagB/SusD family nutrient uptake outer membrane protein [Marinifilum fragile]